MRAELLRRADALRALHCRNWTRRSTFSKRDPGFTRSGYTAEKLLRRVGRLPHEGRVRAVLEAIVEPPSRERTIAARALARES